MKKLKKRLTEMKRAVMAGKASKTTMRWGGHR
jgi:hypothetical protein